MRKPRPVRAGDRIAVVATASNCAREEFDRGVLELRRLRFEPVWDETVFEQGAMTAGSPATRAAAFIKAWSDPDVAALIAVRGGYGSVELLPLLAGCALDPPKLFIGYSDNTSLLAWLTTRRGIPALHGPMLDGRLARGTAAYDEPSLVALLQGGAGLKLDPPGVRVLRPGDASGMLAGGTLTQLAASLGTPYAFQPPEGALLFLEDVNERPYRLHRLLTQLKLAGILERASGLVFGEMRGCDEPAPSTTSGGARLMARDVIEEFARGFDGPVVWGFPSGHTSGPCWTVPLGVRCRLSTVPHPSLVVEDAPVE
jgi:muramoyltetrapeptide carboxypeptidase